nr:PREDICTED: gametocyte-specific factor 1 homolog [Tribolium castaneum]|eukprot:XP_008196538.1 PREDICTED: gametocyte-specific factor 1 homolog [Tribolium castaneum]
MFYYSHHKEVKEVDNITSKTSLIYRQSPLFYDNTLCPNREVRNLNQLTSMDDFVSCPFNPQHRMLKANLQHHIIKCMKNYPDYVPCIYNAMHRFPTKEKMIEHIATCPSQRLAISENTPRTTNVAVAKNPLHESKKFHMDEENWDAEYI